MAAQTNYLRSTEIGPLRISIDQLTAVVEKASRLVRVANGQTRITREEMSLGAGTYRVKLSGHEIDPQRTRIPKVVDNFEYSLWFVDSAPVKHFQLSLANYKRTLSVDGESPDQVDSVFVTVRDELAALISAVGGEVPTKLLSAPFAFFILFTPTFLATLIWWDKKYPVALAIVVTCVAIFIATLLLPTGEMFAGFSVIKGDASFVVRYGAEISFWGLVLAVVGICLSAVPLFLKSQPAKP
jgi:hypothetical protein